MRLSFRRRYGRSYEGTVAFVDGAHYPVKKDGSLDIRHRLMLQDGAYVYARPSDPTHLHLYGTGEHKELVPE